MVDGGGTLEREKHAGEFESGVFMTKRTRHWYLWTRLVTAKLQAASASGFGHRMRDTAVAVAHGSEQGKEKGRGGAQPL